jgi:hypothetical protein
LGQKEQASITFDTQIFRVSGQNAEHHKALRALGHEAGCLVATNVSGGIGIGFGQ